MFDLGWTELLVIGVVALIVVGPKDLPGMFRTLGKFTAKIKGMAREFQRAMDDAADEAGVKDIAGDMKKMTSAKNLGLDAVKKATKGMADWPEGATKASDPSTDLGPETAKLSAERAAQSAKTKAATARTTAERLEKEAREAEAAAKAAAKPAAKKAAAKKPAAKKAPAKKTVAKKAPAKKPAAKAAAKPPVKKPAPRKTAAKKPAAKSGDTA